MRSAASLLICLALPAVLAAQAQPTIAKQIEGKDDSSKQVRDSLYVMARAYGEAAVRVNPNGADGHFTIGQALGRLSRTKGGKERVRFAKIIYDEGMKALECDSTHDGANHLIGAWHAEVKRLSGFEKFFAKAKNFSKPDSRLTSACH